jgi:glycosyltransferase involved in cell wall biosynthesis
VPHGVDLDLKVCLTSSYLYPSVVGGAERYVYSLARGLRKLGLEITIITSRLGESSCERASESGIRTIFVHPLLSIGANPLAPDLLRILKKEAPDIVHMQAPTLFGDVTALSSRFLGIPVVSTYHGNITQSSVPHSLLKLYNLLHLNMSLKKCNHIITTTSRYMTILEQGGISQANISVIPVGVEREFADAKVHPEAEDRFEELVHEIKYTPKFRLLFVGALDRYHEYKGLENLLIAFRTIVQNHPDSLLIIVGDGDKKLFYEVLADDLGVGQNTLFTGWVSRELLIAMYSRSDLFVLPSCSFSEGFGIVLLEAISRGCPVLTTIYAGGSEAVREAKAGIVVDGADAQLLSGAIETFINDAEFTESCKKNGVSEVKQKYTWDIISPEISKIYKLYTRN